MGRASTLITHNKHPPKQGENRAETENKKMKPYLLHAQIRTPFKYRGIWFLTVRSKISSNFRNSFLQLQEFVFASYYRNLSVLLPSRVGIPPPVGGEVPMFRPEPARTLPFCPDALLGGMPHLRLAMIDLTGSNIPDEWLRENHQVVLRRHIWS